MELHYYFYAPIYLLVLLNISRVKDSLGLEKVLAALLHLIKDKLHCVV